jgi:hypothetical protein
MNEPTLFKPHALMKARVIREGRITRDLTMPDRDWSEFDAPAAERRTSRLIRNEVKNER